MFQSCKQRWQVSPTHSAVGHTRIITIKLEGNHPFCGTHVATGWNIYIFAQSKQTARSFDSLLLLLPGWNSNPKSQAFLKVFWVFCDLCVNLCFSSDTQGSFYHTNPNHAPFLYFSVDFFFQTNIHLHCLNPPQLGKSNEPLRIPVMQTLPSVRSFHLHQQRFLVSSGLFWVRSFLRVVSQRSSAKNGGKPVWINEF